MTVRGGFPPGIFPGPNYRGLRATVQVPYNPGKFNRRQGPMRKVGRGTCGPSRFNRKESRTDWSKSGTGSGAVRSKSGDW